MRFDLWVARSAEVGYALAAGGQRAAGSGQQ